MSHSRQIVTVETVSADSDGAAHDHARARVPHHPGAATYELWRKGKRVAPPNAR